MVVVLPTPLTPTTISTNGPPCGAVKSRGRARGASIRTISRRSARVRATASVNSRAAMRRRKSSTSDVVAATPTSAVSSTVSSSSSSASSSFGLPENSAARPRPSALPRSRSRQRGRASGSSIEGASAAGAGVDGAGGVGTATGIAGAAGSTAGAATAASAEATAAGDAGASASPWVGAAGDSAAVAGLRFQNQIIAGRRLGSQNREIVSAGFVAMPQPPRKVRIIAGRLRGSKLEVPDRPGLRPTADRVRETLFNWLAPRIAGARCLDLFAGSGALGLEAISRGRPARSWSSAIRRWPRPCAARSRDSAPPGPRSAAPTRSPSSQVQPLRSTWSSSIRPSMPTCGRGSPRGSPRAVGWRRGRWCTSSGRPIASRPCRRRFDSIAKVVPARCGTRSMSSTRQPAIRSRRGRRRPGGPGPGTGRPR